MLDPASSHYDVLHRWIKEGVKPDAEPIAARPNAIEVLPKEIDLDLPGRTQRLVVIARYPDGTTRDVTREAASARTTRRSPRSPTTTKSPASAGARPPSSCAYEGNYGVANVSVMGDRTGFAFAPMPEHNFIDRHVNAKLAKRKILPSGECTDAEFLRRAYLDLVGIPTAARAKAFVEDNRPSREKRTRLVDELIGSRDFVAYWSNKWADLLQNNSKTLGDDGVWVFREWIRQSVAQNKPYDAFARELLTAQGSNFANPAVNYFRTLKDKDDARALTTNKITEDVSQTFLGVRFNCNKCHDHPFERWTQKQYYEFGAYFARVAFKPGGRPGEEVVYTNYNGGEVTHPKTNLVMAPKVPYGQEPDVSGARVRQDAFAQWMTSSDNPLFARSYVNRVWSYFFGRGIIDPVDDIREQPAGQSRTARRGSPPTSSRTASTRASSCERSPPRAPTRQASRRTSGTRTTRSTSATPCPAG